LKIYAANVGDSRAVICECKNNKWKAKPLSIDHKPNNPEEQKRILKHGGRVEPYWGNFINFITNIN